MTTPATDANPSLGPVFPGYDPTNHYKNVAVQVGPPTQDGTTGVWYGPLAVDVTVSVDPASNQRVNTQAGDIAAGSAVSGAFVAGAIADLSTLPASLTELLGDTDNLANIPAKGSAAMAGSTPVTIATNDTVFAELLTDTDNLATMVPGVQGWIAATGTGTASQDDTLTFAQQVRKVALYNASANPVPLEFDQTSTANSFPLQAGQYMIVDDVLCTTIHVFPSALLPINTANGLYVKGWK